MIHCPKCSNENADNAHFCGFCGARLQKAGPSQTIFGMQAAVKEPAVKEPAANPQPAPQATLPTPTNRPSDLDPQDIAPTQPLDDLLPAAAAFADTQASPAVPSRQQPQQPASPAQASKPAPAEPSPRPSPAPATQDSHTQDKDKEDEKAFFGTSLSKYDLKGLDRSELVMDDPEPPRKSALPLIIGIALLLGAVAGAVVYFVVMS